MEAVLEDAPSLVAFLRNLEHSAGLSIYETNLSEEMAAALISKKVGLDFDDTLQYYVAKKLGVDALVSFEEHFDKLDLRRVEPRDLLRLTEKQEHSDSANATSKSSSGPSADRSTLTSSGDIPVSILLLSLVSLAARHG